VVLLYVDVLPDVFTGTGAGTGAAVAAAEVPSGHHTPSAGAVMPFVTSYHRPVLGEYSLPLLGAVAPIGTSPTHGLGFGQNSPSAGAASLA
jgi:hypothetical protein